MKGRFSTGVLALFLGTFGAQKFYLGRKKEGVLCLLLAWTGFSTFLGIFEGLWILSRTTAQWEEYLKTLESPDWYLNPSILKLYLYPVSLSAFVLSVAQSEHPVFRYAGLLLLAAVWLYPGKDEKILENRFVRVKSYPGRIIATFLLGITLASIITQGGVQPPKIQVLSETNTTQTGGIYELKIQAIPSTKVSVNGKDIEKTGDNTYKVLIPIDEKTSKAQIHAENKGKFADQEVTITRAQNAEELATIEKRKQEAEVQRIALEKAKQEELQKQQAEEARCMKDAKCRKQKEDEKRLKEMIEKDAKLEEWIKAHGVSAWSFCKQSTQSRLKSPSTADFPWADYKIWAAGGVLYVHSYVDAQNGFGAQIRSNFTCKFELQNDELTLVDLNIN